MGTDVANLDAACVHGALVSTDINAAQAQHKLEDTIDFWTHALHKTRLQPISSVFPVRALASCPNLSSSKDLQLSVGASSACRQGVR